ncbi:hypothetical protein PF003_g12442 [Phytophthora fragariae]|nr:hypothetical protein PF003_g17238 [Phytophthora fragariae]KAE8903871.1 hypothetical protein PF003_g12442 [Phytophthora fragariae]
MALERNILETVQQCMLGRVPIGSTGFVVNAMSTLITLAQDFVDASDAPTKSAKSEKWSLNTMTSTTRTTTMATRSTTYLTVLSKPRVTRSSPRRRPCARSRRRPPTSWSCGAARVWRGSLHVAHGVLEVARFSLVHAA